MEDILVQIEVFGTWDDEGTYKGPRRKRNHVRSIAMAWGNLQTGGIGTVRNQGLVFHQQEKLITRSARSTRCRPESRKSVESPFPVSQASDGACCMCGQSKRIRTKTYEVLKLHLAYAGPRYRVFRREPRVLGCCAVGVHCGFVLGPNT